MHATLSVNVTEAVSHTGYNLTRNLLLYVSCCFEPCARMAQNTKEQKLSLVKTLQFFRLFCCYKEHSSIRVTSTTRTLPNSQTG